MAKNSEIYVPPTTTAASQAPAVPPTNTLAVVGFILSIFGFFSFVSAIPGVVLGHIALKQVRTSGESGHGLAVAALAVGYAIIGLGVLTVLAIIVAVLVPLIIIGVAAANGGY